MYIYNIYKYIYICLNLRTIISKLIMKQTSFVMADYCDICNMRICNAQTSVKNKNFEGYRFSDLIKEHSCVRFIFSRVSMSPGCSIKWFNVLCYAPMERCKVLIR